MALISSINGATRRIYLDVSTVGATIHPMDIYKEVRTLRRTDEALRKWETFLTAFGNVAKGSGKFTERYVRCNAGTRIVPYDASQEITINGTIITDDGQEGIACFDRAPLTITTVVDINYIPPQVEIITVSTGSGLDATQTTQLARIHSLLDNIEGTLDHAEIMRVLLSGMAGLLSGVGTNTLRFRNLANNLDRIVATTNTAGDRTEITLNVS